MDKDSLDIIRLNNGSKPAFVSLYNKYVGRIYSYIRSMVSEDSLSEDLTQFCFMKIWEHRKEIKADANFPAYLYVIARNAVFKEMRRMLTSNAYIDFISKSSSFTDNATQQDVYFKLLQEKIEEIVSKLPNARRRIYIMSANQLMTNEEIAHTLNISPKSVETQLRRVNITLRKELSNFK